MKSKQVLRPLKFILWILFILYIFTAYRLIIWKGWGGLAYISQCYASIDIWKQEVLWNLNLVPLRFVFDVHGYTFITWCKNVIGNIILFIPMGFFLPCLFPKVRVWSMKKYIFAMAALIIGIEVFQLFFMCGHCDIDDLILNLSGACLGFAATRRALKMKGSLDK